MRRLAIPLAMAAVVMALLPLRPAAAANWCTAEAYEPDIAKWGALPNQITAATIARCGTTMTALKVRASLERDATGDSGYYSHVRDSEAIETNTSWAAAEVFLQCPVGRSRFRNAGDTHYVNYEMALQGDHSSTSAPADFVCMSKPLEEITT